MSKITKAEKT